MIELERKETPEGIWVGAMKDGEVAVIVAWPFEEYVGRVVQRYGPHLVSIGMNCGAGWSGFWPAYISKNSCVRLLERGEKLVVT